MQKKKKKKKKKRDELLYTKIHTIRFFLRSGFKLSNETEKLAFTHVSVSSWLFETPQPHKRWVSYFCK
jgi:hypothetical protein